MCWGESICLQQMLPADKDHGPCLHRLWKSLPGRQGNGIQDWDREAVSWFFQSRDGLEFPEHHHFNMELLYHSRSKAGRLLHISLTPLFSPDPITQESPGDSPVGRQLHVKRAALLFISVFWWTSQWLTFTITIILLHVFFYPNTC